MAKKITALKVQSRNPQRMNVYLDGEFAFGLSRLVAVWLQEGQALNEEKIADLKAEDAHEVAYQRALNLIVRRMRSGAKIQENLRRHGISEEIIASVVERLERSGMIDDKLFAQAWVENRSEFRPRSKRALVYELRQRGIAEDVIDQALTENMPDEAELAYQAALKYSRKLNRLEWLEFRRKLSGHLARRGFSYDIVIPVVDRVWAELTSNFPTRNNLTD